MPAYKDETQNTWYSQFYYVDWTGKRQKKHKRGFKTKREAVIYETEFKRVAEANMNMKLKSFVEVYFKDKEPELKLRSITNKRLMIEKHIIPYFGEKPMNEITPADILAWQSEIIENNNYSQSYLRMLQNQITAIFTHAHKIYGLGNSPCKKVKKMGKSDARSLVFWTLEEYQRFISTYKPGSRSYVMFEILFWTGILEAELLALTMDDFDESQLQLHINKTFYRLKQEDYVNSPKTYSSTRTIDLPEFLMKEVKEYYMKLYAYRGDERLFPVVAKTVQKTMKEHARKAELKEIRVHDLRHSHCAYLIHKGVQPLIIKERMGHKDIKITLNTYGHLYPSEQKKVASLLDDVKKQNNE